MSEVLKRGDMSLINCTVSEKRSLPNVIEIRINANNRDAFKCTPKPNHTHNCVPSTSTQKAQRNGTELFHLFDIGVLFGSRLDSFFSAFVFQQYSSVCECFLLFGVSFVCSFVYFLGFGCCFECHSLQHKIVKQHPNCCNTYIMP